MDKKKNETLVVRIISVGFSCLAFAVFKPLGIGCLGTMLYVHFLAIWLLGVVVCYVTEAIVRYVIGMPPSLDRGVDYVIRRNLWFQVVNTPLESLMICLYLHFPMSAAGAVGFLSFRSILQTFMLLAFCSFAVGLYWRYKFRSRYLAMELEETRQLNVRLREETGAGVSESVTLTGTTNESVTLQVADLLYIETVGNYAKVWHLCNGRSQSDMLRATSKQIAAQLQAYPVIVRCHRAFLVNLRQVERVVSKTGAMHLVMKHGGESIPVSRSNIAHIKDIIRQAM